MTTRSGRANCAPIAAGSPEITSLPTHRSPAWAKFTEIRAVRGPHLVLANAPVEIIALPLVCFVDFFNNSARLDQVAVSIGSSHALFLKRRNLVVPGSMDLLNLIRLPYSSISVRSVWRTPTWCPD
jgi:hypothetical protein